MKFFIIFSTDTVFMIMLAMALCKHFGYLVHFTATRYSMLIRVVKRMRQIGPNVGSKKAIVERIDYENCPTTKR
jgi:hypothetical protein